MRRFDLHQALAEKKSRRLIVAMIAMQVATVIFCSAFISLVFAGIYFWWYPETAFPNLTVVYFSASTTALAVSVIIVSGGYMKMSELDGGGSKVAEGMNGLLIDESNLQLNKSQRRLLNVVQELAIASSIPAPPVYILTGEPGINAMAAGHCYQDAVLIVTAGAVRHLSRDQMQGVIAHEIAHILNGDISRDMWLTAATHGNYSLLITAEEMSSFRRYEGPSVEAYLGYMLLPFGYLSACLARLFTARIKCQNEYMADATAVELARYPQGLSDALMMIGGFEHKGRVKCARAIETNHMFLVESGWSWVASHPPLDKRILRLRPDWDGYYLYESPEDLDGYCGIYKEITELVETNRQAVRRDKAKEVVTELAAVIPAMLGSTNENTITTEQPLPVGSGKDEVPAWMAHDSSQEIEIEPTFRQLVKDHQGAGLVLAGIRLDQFDAQTAAKVIAKLNPLVSGSVNQLLPAISGLSDRQKLWLFDRSIETIVSASGPVRQLFLEFVAQASIALEDETDLARWAWQRIVSRRMNPKKAPVARLGDLRPLMAEVMVLLSIVTHTDADGEQLAEYNFMRAMAHTGLRRSVLLSKSDLTIAHIEEAIGQLSYLSALQRRNLVVACTASIVANRSTNTEEAWMLRAICDGFNFPMPSVLPGQELLATV